jgi:hypothetical protein
MDISSAGSTLAIVGSALPTEIFSSEAFIEAAPFGEHFGNVVFGSVNGFPIIGLGSLTPKNFEGLNRYQSVAVGSDQMEVRRNMLIGANFDPRIIENFEGRHLIIPAQWK